MKKIGLVLLLVLLGGLMLIGPMVQKAKADPCPSPGCYDPKIIVTQPQ